MMILGWLLAALGVLGLWHSTTWATTNDDRPGDFILGAILLLLGFLALKTAQGL